MEDGGFPAASRGAPSPLLSERRCRWPEPRLHVLALQYVPRALPTADAGLCVDAGKVILSSATLHPAARDGVQVQLGRGDGVQVRGQPRRGGQGSRWPCSLFPLAPEGGASLYTHTVPVEPSVYSVRRSSFSFISTMCPALSKG